MPIAAATDEACDAMKAEIEAAVNRMKDLVHPDFTLNSIFIPVPITFFGGLSDTEKYWLYLRIVRGHILQHLFEASGGAEGKNTWTEGEAANAGT